MRFHTGFVGSLLHVYGCVLWSIVDIAVYGCALEFLKVSTKKRSSTYFETDLPNTGFRRVLMKLGASEPLYGVQMVVTSLLLRRLLLGVVWELLGPLGPVEAGWVC